MNGDNDDFMDVDDSEAEAYYKALAAAAEKGGYFLNPDMEMTMELVRGLIVNTRRYGYPACPCRMASGRREEDLDIICPCDYRDDDISEYGTCYCGLYVSRDVYEGRKAVEPIPDRRVSSRTPTVEGGHKMEKVGSTISSDGRTLTMWRCVVCGYVCIRETPPDVCPICRASSDRFEALAAVSEEGFVFKK